ncbi:RNA-directed DNA polymerase, eukaryota [Tanacetum coccineum]|uniref:RNA-directed DNA polymerase, eukaryota n=1 Tax=Tanacetum coccineum TaxID=301880 RepID=A0ABQ5H551_9ASTR
MLYQKKMMESEVPLALVLNDECLLSKDLPKFLLGRVKQFVSLANLRKAVSNEGFVNIKIQYMRELWVLLEFGSEDSMKLFQDNVSIGSWFSQLKQATMEFTNEGRIAWVEVEGIPFKLWTDNTFKRIATKWGELLDIDDQEEMCFHSKRLCIYTKTEKNIFEEFKIIFRGKTSWIRAKETPGWVPDFMEENDDEEQSDVDSKEGEFKVHDTGIYGGDSDVEEARETLFEKSGKKENNLDEEHKDKQEKNSEDPFNIYKLLKKKKDTTENEINSEQTMKYPPGFTPKEGSKEIVWDCGTDKSPGPDGFTFGFYRRFWKIIENDVYDAVKYFFTYGNIPKGCNSSFIALIPKIPDANMVKDFRPISLIGSLYKIIAKILANRLVGVLGDIVNEVQSAFIAERQILDGPFILNEILQWSKTKKKQSLIFKVDFEKAYDSVRWDFLDDILKKFGFGEKWCKWIQSCLRSSRGSILINGSPTEEFQFYKGLKQGDPLSPFLFILIMESLHLSFQRVVDNGMFNGIKLSSSLSISHLFYADDAVFMGQWCDGNISTLIHVLECFYRASGLRINMSKSKILGVNVDSDKVKGAASKLGCLILKTPFTYLGSKVGGSMSRVHAWNEVIDRVKNRLSKWKMKTLSIGGRLTLLKSVLGSIPIFHMSIYRAPLSVLRTLESIRSKFFKGHDINSNKASWVNWKKVLASKEKGGLGVSSLFALNRGLMFKWIWRFYTQNTLLWVRVVKAIHGDDGNVGGHVKSGAKSCWLDIVRETHALKTKGINLLDCMHVKLGNGDKTVFWEDIWIDGKTLKNRFPRIYSLESCKLITVGAKLAQPSLEYSFRRNPRGGVEQDQFNELSALVHDVSLIPMSDRWKWDLESSGDFSVASVRKIIDDKSLSDVDSKTRWIKYVPIKVNVHAWKVKTDSLPTRFNVSRRGIDIDSIMCAICDNGVETSRHLFFYCCMVRQIVRKITRWWDVPYVEVESYEDWYNWLVNLRISSMHKQMFEGVFYVMWWHLWSFRNKLIFDSKPPSQALFFDDVVSMSFHWCSLLLLILLLCHTCDDLCKASLGNCDAVFRLCEQFLKPLRCSVVILSVSSPNEPKSRVFLPKAIQVLQQHKGMIKGLSAEEAWETIKDYVQCDKQWKNPTSTITDQTIANLKAQFVGNEVVRVKIPKCMSWLDSYDEPIGNQDMMKDKVDNPCLQSTLQVLPSSEGYTPLVTYQKEVEETLGTLMKVEPLDQTQLEDVGLNTCSHDLFLSFKEVPSFDEPNPQLQTLLNFPSLDVSQGEERGSKPPIKPHSPNSFRMKEVDILTIHTPPLPHVASFYPKDVSQGFDFSNLEVTENNFLGGLSLPVKPKELEKGEKGVSARETGTGLVVTTTNSRHFNPQSGVGVDTAYPRHGYAVSSLMDTAH